MAVLVGPEVACVIDERTFMRLLVVEWTKCVLDERQLCKAASSLPVPLVVASLVGPEMTFSRHGHCRAV